MKKDIVRALSCTVLTGVLLTGCAFGSTAQKEPEQQNPNKEGQTGQDSSQETEDGASKTDSNETEETRTVAISMPDGSVQRWVDDAFNLKTGLEAKGYAVTVQYAQNDASLQASQIEEFVSDGAGCIILAPVASEKLAAAADTAKNAGIPIVSYDSLLMDTDAVSFYLTFDQKGIGNLLGQSIIEKAGLDKLDDGEYQTIEFFMGQPDDANAELVYKGLMEALGPYLDDGRLICRSGRTSFQDTSVKGDLEEKTSKRCKKYLKNYYTEEDLDICAAAYDTQAYGCKAACTAAGYTKDNWPVVSGQGCELAACRNILEGTQAFSVYKDSRILAVECTSLVDAVINGIPPQVNETEQYHNGKMAVPAHVCTPSVVDADNLEELMIDSGYYTKEQVMEQE